MKKNYYLFLCVMVLLLFSACDKDAEVKQLMTDFSAAVAKNDKATIEKLYPNAAKADSLSLTFDAEKAQIEKMEDGSYKVVLGEGKDAIIGINEADGNMTINSSHGVFAYPRERMDFATGTGLYDRTLDDAQNADRMADTQFVKYLTDKASKIVIADLQSKVKVTRSDMYDLYKGIVVVSNQTSRQIDGDEYVVTVKEHCMGGIGWNEDGSPYRDFFDETLKLTNKPIPANGKVTYLFDTGNCSLESTIKIQPKAENILKDYKPTGKEYAEYLASKTR